MAVRILVLCGSPALDINKLRFNLKLPKPLERLDSGCETTWWNRGRQLTRNVTIAN